MDGCPVGPIRRPCSLILRGFTRELQHRTASNRQPASTCPLLGVLRRRALDHRPRDAARRRRRGGFRLRHAQHATSRRPKLLFRQTIGAELNALGLLPGTPDADNLAPTTSRWSAPAQVAEATATRLASAGDDVAAARTSQNDVKVTRRQEHRRRRRDRQGRPTATTRRAWPRLRGGGRPNRQRRRQREQARRALDNLEQPVRRAARRRSRTLPRGRQAPGAHPAADAPSPTSAPAARASSSPAVHADRARPATRSRRSSWACCSALLLGVGLALLREQSDRKLRRTEQVTAAFDAPVLTTVPAQPRAEAPQAVRGPAARGGRGVPDAADEPALRSRRAGAQRAGHVGAQPARARRPIAWNLAAAAASGGLSVALVEADLRRPSLAERYDLEPAPGLAEALQGEVSISAALQTILPVQGSANPVGHPRPLHVIVAGQAAPNPWALMQSSVMARVLDVLRKDHDLVVVDTPPLPHVADAISLLRHVDGVLVTASVNSHARPGGQPPARPAPGPRRQRPRRRRQRRLRDERLRGYARATAATAGVEQRRRPPAARRSRCTSRASRRAPAVIASPPMGEQPREPLAADLGWLLAQASHALKTELTAALEGLGVSPRAHHVLMTARAGRATRRPSWRSIVGLDKTTMVVTLDELEAARPRGAPPLG